MKKQRERRDQQEGEPTTWILWYFLETLARISWGILYLCVGVSHTSLVLPTLTCFKTSINTWQSKKSTASCSEKESVNRSQLTVKQIHCVVVKVCIRQCTVRAK